MSNELISDLEEEQIEALVANGRRASVTRKICWAVVCLVIALLTMHVASLIDTP